MLSVEEEAILTDEHNEASQALDQATADADRVTEVAEVATDAVQVVDITPQVGQVEAELVGAVGDMAVAGTDADPADVISLPTPTEGAEPAPEGLSVEGIASTLKSIWDAIVTAIKNMWVGLKHWLTTYFSSLEQNKKHAEKLIERLSGMKGYLANDGALLTSAITNIYHYGGKSFLDMSNTIGRQESDFNTYVLDAVQLQHNQMNAVGLELSQAYAKYDGGATDHVSQVIDNVTKHLVDYMAKLKLIAKGSEMSTKPVAGMRVVVKGYNENVSDDVQSVETKIALLSKVRFSADQDTDLSTGARLSVALDVTPDQLLVWVKDRLAFIDNLIKLKDKQFDDLETRVVSVTSACEAMLGRVKATDKESESFAKRLMPLTTAYANWATQPTASLLKTAARHNKFWLSLFEMATNNFRPA